MTSISGYKEKSFNKKSKSSKEGLSQLVSFVHSGTTSNEITPKKKDLSSQAISSNELEKRIQKKEKELEIEFKKKLKKKEQELKKDILQEKHKEDLASTYPLLTPTPSNNEFITNGNEEVRLKTAFKLINKFDRWDSSTKKLFNLIARKTDYGSLQNVNIGRREIEQSIHSSHFKEARDQLLSESIISINLGRTERNNRVTSFYSLNLQPLLN